MFVLSPSSALHSHALMFQVVQRAMLKILMDVLADGPPKHTVLKQKHLYLFPGIGIPCGWDLLLSYVFPMGFARA